MAISNGAIAVVCNELPMNINEAVTYAVSKNSAKALGFISANLAYANIRVKCW